jgi:hypothetical protein
MPRKAAAGQKEMLLTISGKRTRRQEGRYLYSARVYSGINRWAGARLLWVRSRSCLQPISLQNHSVSVRVLWHLQRQTQGVVDGHLSTNVRPPVKAGPAKCCAPWIDGGDGPDVENISVGPPFVDTFASNVAKKPLSSRFAISVVVLVLNMRERSAHCKMGA